MQILAHRGLWNLHDFTPRLRQDSTPRFKQDSAPQIKPNKPNSLKSFECAFKNGFGIETDLRDFNENLVISHDIATSSAVKAEQLFILYQQFARESNVCKSSTNPANLPPLALNTKADGLQNLLKNLLEKYRITNYFCFDMSVPDMRIFAKSGLKFFTRQSEIEPNPALYDDAKGVWCDEFYNHWISKETILGHLENGKKVAIVSPELHKRDYKNAWQNYAQILQSCKLQNNPNIFLCTDFPLLAQEFFANPTTANPTTKDFKK